MQEGTIYLRSPDHVRWMAHESGHLFQDRHPELTRDWLENTPVDESRVHCPVQVRDQGMFSYYAASGYRRDGSSICTAPQLTGLTTVSLGSVSISYHPGQFDELDLLLRLSKAADQLPDILKENIRGIVIDKRLDCEGMAAVSEEFLTNVTGEDVAVSLDMPYGLRHSLHDRSQIEATMGGEGRQSREKTCSNACRLRPTEKGYSQCVTLLTLVSS